MAFPDHLVALGSSFAAGPGIEPVVDRAARRSGRNYAALLAEQTGATLTDLSVSGATTATILDTPQRTRSTVFPPQLDGVPGSADLVTITAGGNDLSYLGSITLSAWSGWLRGRPLTRPLAGALARRASPAVTAADLERATDGLTRVVTEVRRRAPHARVLLVDYLTVLGPQSRPGPDTCLDVASIRDLRRLGGQLDEVFADAAGRSGADLVRASAVSSDHGVGSADPWVNGFLPHLSRMAASFHPNEAGMRAVAAEIRLVLGV